MPPKKDHPDKPKGEPSEQIPAPSSASVSRRGSHNPVVQHDSLSIEEISEDISSEIDKLIHEGKDFEDVFLFYLSKKPFSLEQTSKWLEKFNEFRMERARRSIPKEFTAEQPSEDIRRKYAEETLENFINRLCKKHDWSKELGTKPESPQERHESSSDCTSGDEQPKQSSTATPSHPALSRRLSWKDFKKTEQMDKMPCQKAKNPNVKTLIKLTVKELFKQKKKAKKLAKEKEKGIEVNKEEVVDMIYDATGLMAKRYIPKIRQIATKLDPGLDISGSECESGSYDSEDNFYEHKEDKRSLLPKMVMSVDPELLVKEGLYKILLITLPLCFDYTDEKQLNEFIGILKDTKEQVIPEEIKRRGAPDPLESFKEREGKSSEVKTESVAPSPSNETLAGMAEIKDWRRDSTQEDVLETYISERLQRRTVLRSVGSEMSIGSEESQSTPSMEESASNDPVFPEAVGAESRPTLASPEDISDVPMLEADPSPEHIEGPAGLQRAGSRRRSESKRKPGISSAKKTK